MSEFKCFLTVTTPTRTFKTMVKEKGPKNHALLSAISGWDIDTLVKVDKVIEVKVAD